MQIAPLIDTPSGIRTAYHVVAPGRLFAVARLRLAGAANTIRPDRTAHAPTSLAATIAISQAQAGISALRSILVPTTSFDLRRRAAATIGDAEQGVRVLSSYRDEMLQFGDDSVPLTALTPRTRVLLDEAITRLEDAAARSGVDAPLPC